jgi:hypothetical protein
MVGKPPKEKENTKENENEMGLAYALGAFAEV